MNKPLIVTEALAGTYATFPIDRKCSRILAFAQNTGAVYCDSGCPIFGYLSVRLQRIRGYFMYQHVLVAIDLEQSDIDVLVSAVNISTQHNSRLTILHICEPRVTGYGEETSRHHISNEMQLKQQLFPRIKAIIDSALSHFHDSIQYDTQVLFGRVADTIHIFAEQHDCDLIVVGSHGYAGLKAYLDSTASNVLHGASCDVYTVRVDD